MVPVSNPVGRANRTRLRRSGAHLEVQRGLPALRTRCQATVICVNVEGTDLQADITLGNIASALSIHTEEAALIAELQAGSEEAFSWLITRYHQPIYSLLARTVRDPSDAADLTQDVFVKIFRGIGSFHGESSLRTWIYRIALHEGLNQRRWWRRHKQQEVTIEMETVDCESGEPARLKEMLVDPGESPYEMATHTEARERVEAALRQVPEPFRMTLILRDIEGFVYEEVAEMLGVNLGTIKSRLVRGRACLRQLAPGRRCPAHQQPPMQPWPAPSAAHPEEAQ